MARAQCESDQVLAAARGDQFGGVGETADDGHAGEAGGGGGCEGAGGGSMEERGGSEGGGEGGAEAGWERHRNLGLWEVWMALG